MSGVYDAIIPDWTSKAACLDQWEVFDNGFDSYPTRVCQNCEVRLECLQSALVFEQGEIKRGMGEFAVVGIRGGYTVVERRDLHKAIEQGGWGVVKELQL